MVRIVIGKTELDAMADNELLRQVLIARRMKAAGILMPNRIAMLRPSRGSLSIVWDAVFEELTITWHE